MDRYRQKMQLFVTCGKWDGAGMDESVGMDAAMMI